MPKNNQIVIENFLKMTPQVPQYSQKNQNYLIAGANPISYLDDGTQEDQAAPLQASIDWENITPLIIDGSGATTTNVDIKMGSGYTPIVGQTFTGNGKTTLSFSLWIKKIGTITGGLISSILYSTSGTPGTNAVGNHIVTTGSTITEASVTSSYVLYNFTITATLTSGVNYAIALSNSGGDGSNYFIIQGNNSNPLPSQNSFTGTGIGGFTPSATIDLIFNVYSGIVSTIIEGNIVAQVSSTDGYYSTYAITDTSKVYGITTTVVTDLGYINNSTSQSNTGFCLAIAGGGTGNGYLFATSANSGNVYYMPLSSHTTGNWVTYSTNPLQTSVGAHILEPFLDWLAVKDGNTSYLQGGRIRKFDTVALTMSTLPVLDLGAGFGIMQMRNYNDKYLAIAAGKTGTGGTVNGYPQNYIFLWDGISNRYNYSMRVPGQFIDMKVVDSQLYVAVKVSRTKTCIYKLVNTYLRKVFTTQISTVYDTNYSAVNQPLFDFKNYLGVHLNTNSDLSNPILIQGQDEQGDLEFVHSYGRQFENFSVGYDGNLFVNEYISGGNSVIYYLPTSGMYQQLLYKSQWIPVKNLQAIDIYHDAPPTSGTDAINVTIDGQGEDILNGSSTTALSSITPTAYLTKKRTRLDAQGFTGSQLKITLSTINSTWRPKINAIVAITK